MRIMLTETPWMGGSFTTMVGNGGSGKVGGYSYGETEDYIFTPDTSCDECPDMNCDGTVNFIDMAKLGNKWLESCP